MYRQKRNGRKKLIMTFPFLGFGGGLRTEHYPYILKNWPQIDWFEIISENYMVGGGRPLYTLDKIRSRYPMVMHGVSLSIGSTDPLNFDYLAQLKKLMNRVNPAWVSDHLCWTGVAGHNLHDLLPLPYNEETLKHVINRIKQVQDFLERPIALENASSYMEFHSSTMTEWEFLKTISDESNCLILLDINNIYVSAVNHGFNPIHYVDAIPQDKVIQFHLAGHTDKGRYLLDTHDHPMKEEVLQLYAHALKRFGAISTLLEWDDKIPSFPKLMNELNRAKDVYANTILAQNSGEITSVHLGS